MLHLGDLALGPIAESLPLTAQLHGRRFLVPGNHDRVSPATQTNRGIERFAPLYEKAGWVILPEVVSGTRAEHSLLASRYPYSGDTQDEDRHPAHRPVDGGLPLLHGHTHDRENGPLEHQFHVGVDAFGFAPIPMTLIDAWLEISAARRRRSRPSFANGRRRGPARRCRRSPIGSGSTSKASEHSAWVSNPRYRHHLQHTAPPHTCPKPLTWQS